MSESDSFIYWELWWLKLYLYFQAFSDEFATRANGNIITDKISKAESTQGSVKLLNRGIIYNC